MKRRELVGNLALGLGVSALFLAVVEGGARLLEKKRPPRPEVADYIWDWDDKMPGGFYVMKSDGVGWPPWEEFNADGLRDRTRTKERPPGYRRIAFLGDSVTLGAELQPQEAYPQLLEARFAAEGRRTEVMNVALWGWSTRQERTAWQRIVRGYHPDQAVLAVCLNDIPELQNNLARPARWLVALHERLAIVRLLIDPEGREIDSVERLFSEPDSPRVKEALARFFDEVRALRRDVEADGAEFALVVFPFRFQVQPGAPKPVVQERIAAFCQGEKLTCRDLLPAIAPRGAEAFHDYDHLSPDGHSLVADTLQASGLLVEGASDPRVLRDALERSKHPGASAAVRWVAARHTVPETSGLAAIGDLLDEADPQRQAGGRVGTGRGGVGGFGPGSRAGGSAEAGPGAGRADGGRAGAGRDRQPRGCAGALGGARGSERERARRSRAGPPPHRTGARRRASTHGSGRERGPLRGRFRRLEPRQPRSGRRAGGACTRPGARA